MKLNYPKEWFERSAEIEGNAEIGAGCPAVPCSLSFDPSDPEVMWILGRPCFVCGPIAHILQAGGHPIPKHAEEEQAAVIVWMLEKYQQHGREDWKRKADEELVEIRTAATARLTHKANDQGMGREDETPPHANT